MPESPSFEAPLPPPPKVGRVPTPDFDPGEAGGVVQPIPARIDFVETPHPALRATLPTPLRGAAEGGQ